MSDEIPEFAMDALSSIKAKRLAPKNNTNEFADHKHHGKKISLHLRSNASLLNNTSLFDSTPLFETLETTFADINDSEDEFLDDDEVDDDDYEYETDEDWESDEENNKNDDNNNNNNNNNNNKINKAVTFKPEIYKAKIKLPPAPKDTLKVKAKSYGSSLNSYKHFKIRSVTIYGNLQQPKLKKYRTIGIEDIEDIMEEKSIEKEEKKGKNNNKNKNKNKNKEKEKREFIKTEIIETEKNYLKGLECLLNEFIKPIFSEKMIPIKYKKEVTSIIPMIIKLHIEFLDELECEYKKGENGNMSSSFIKISDFFKLYIDYIMKYQTILDIFAKHNKSSKLKKYLKEKRKQRKPLTNHLILPIQRIPRYMLLLQDLKNNTNSKHKNYDTICQAFEIVNKVANSINERKREIENMSQCLQVMENLRECNRNIVEPHRRYLAQFLFRKKDNQRPREFFVFSDLILICNVKMKVKMILEMRTLELKKQSSSIQMIIGKNQTKINSNNNIISYLKKMNSSDTASFNTKENEFTLYTAKGKPIEYETDIDKIDDIIQLNELIIKSRLQVWDGDLSRLSNDGKSKTRDALKKSGVSQAQQYRSQLETLQKLREKKDQSLMNVFKKSHLIKGKKNKVLEMLGADQ